MTGGEPTLVAGVVFGFARGPARDFP